MPSAEPAVRVSNGLSTCLARCSRRLRGRCFGWCPRGWDVATAVADHFDAGCSSEHNPAAGQFPGSGYAELTSRDRSNLTHRPTTTKRPRQRVNHRPTAPFSRQLILAIPLNGTPSYAIWYWLSPKSATTLTDPPRALMYAVTVVSSARVMSPVSI